MDTEARQDSVRSGSCFLSTDFLLTQLSATLRGQVQIDSPFSGLLGKPPVMVAGMTLSTVKALRQCYSQRWLPR